MYRMRYLITAPAPLVSLIIPTRNGLAMQPGVGAVGARLWYPNDTSLHGGVIIGLGGVAGHSHKY
ncbi:hypothetical protein MCEGE14_02291 [Burkholderiaceae bacterium]